MLRLKRLFIISIFWALAVPGFGASVKVACVGDSITFGAGVAAREKLSYPAQVGDLLGEGYVIGNFGKSGATMLNKGDLPYRAQAECAASRAFSPDIVILMLGTNDSKAHNWEHKGDFVADAVEMIRSYQSLPSHPRVILCKPVVVAKDNFGITERVVRREVAPLIEKAALEAGVELLDMHPVQLDQPDLLPDGVHPNASGAERMARHVARYLKVPRSVDVALKYPKSGKTPSFHGFEMLEFKMDGVPCRIAKPRVPAKGVPWVWRARFWGHEPQFDVAMLELGWHVVYCEVGGLFGAPVAVERWNEFYRGTRRIGLHPKPVLEGMSRGGLIIHNWAAANPEKVAGLIADNAVLDFTSWPAGLGAGKGSAKDWEICKKVYGFKIDEEAKNSPDKPVDTAADLVKAGIPILYLAGLDDDVVPPAENCFVVSGKFEGNAGCRVIKKPGKGHHPHSLPNPEPMVEFALAAAGLDRNPAE